MNMLSKIVSNEDTEKLVLEAFQLPSAEDISVILAEKKRENERNRILEDNKEDPVKAAKREANNILIEAQEKLKEAEVEANVLKNRKEKELRDKLEKEFHGKLDKEIKTLRQNYLNSLDEVSALKESLYKKSENQLMHLVFSIARKVLDNEIRTSPDVVVSMLKKGFEKIKEAREYEIKVNPEDYNIVAGKKGEFGELLKTAGSVRITKDEQIERGGCLIVTEQGEISSEPGKQLDIIAREMTDGV
jgi:flagellar assembly protein FliH